MKIMVADDELSLLEALQIIFTDAGYEYCKATDGLEAIDVFQSQKPDLVVLDISMPKIDGFSVCEYIRRKDPEVPIIMLSAKTDIVDKRVGFKSGADDYLTKPFNEEEIVLRAEALLRRRDRIRKVQDASDNDTAQSGSLQVIKVGDLEIDPYRYEVRVHGRAAVLTPKEFQILALLAGSPGKVFTREDLIDTIWGEEYQSSSVSIPVYIRRIREKIEDDPAKPRFLQTVWCHGYRLGD